jgi:hypothetical protein
MNWVISKPLELLMLESSASLGALSVDDVFTLSDALAGYAQQRVQLDDETAERQWTIKTLRRLAEEASARRAAERHLDEVLSMISFYDRHQIVLGSQRGVDDGESRTGDS